MKTLESIARTRGNRPSPFKKAMAGSLPVCCGAAANYMPAERELLRRITPLVPKNSIAKPANSAAAPTAIGPATLAPVLAKAVLGPALPLKVLLLLAPAVPAGMTASGVRTCTVTLAEWPLVAPVAVSVAVPTWLSLTLSENIPAESALVVSRFSAAS